MLEWARSTWSKVIGQHEVGKMNQNGLSLLSLCAEHQLVITGTIFQMKIRLKTTWQHPRSKHWHLHRKDVLTTLVMRGAECWTDHLMVRSKLTMTGLTNSAEIQSLLKTKHEAHKALLSCPGSPTIKTTFNAARTATQRGLRNMGDTWRVQKAKEIQNLDLLRCHKNIVRPQEEGDCPSPIN